jgi:protein tyrosine/serine phosphatase
MKKIVQLILCFSLCQIGTTYLESKNFFKKVMKVATWNPIKATIKSVTSANPLIPTNLYDIKTDYIDNFCVVQDGVFYRSAQLSAKTLDSYIKGYGIKSVVNLRGENPHANWWKKEAAVARKNNVNFFNVPMTASKLTSRKNIKSILNIFDNAPRPILIHCQAGIDRTGEVAALWVLDQQHKSRSTAMKQLSIWHRHNRSAYPAKDFLIKIWQGRTWFEQEYNPANFPKFETQEDWA